MAEGSTSAPKRSMAEGDAPPSKQRRLIDTDQGTYVSLFERPCTDSDIKTNVLTCMEDLRSSFLYSLTLISLKYCNADTPSLFSDAYCDLKHYRDQAVTFGFMTVFQRGISVVERYLAESGAELTETEKLAVQRLFHFFRKIDDVAECLSRGNERNEKNETAWAIQLTHHVFKALAVEQYYVMDRYSKHRVQRCICCDEKITGDYGDTSIGNEKVWHGCADILMGHQSVALKFEEMSDKDPATDETEEKIPTSSFEIQSDSSLSSYQSQIIAETIVFGFLQRKIHCRSAKNFLIPTIAVSKKDVMIYFYDAHLDFLLSSSLPLPLILPSGKLNYHTLFALWLTINYPVTCSGITDKMAETEFNAGFQARLDDKIKYIYDHQLRFGDCRNKVKHAYVCRGTRVVSEGKPFMDGVE